MRALIAAVRDGFTDRHAAPDPFQQELPGGWVVLHWRKTGNHTADAFGFRCRRQPGRHQRHRHHPRCRRQDRITEIYHVEELL
jgi:hypothetical protein